MANAEFSSILSALDRGESPVLRRETEGAAVLRRFLPEERLILLGGGHIAMPLCRMGAMLGFSVVVADDRPAFAHSQRFPDADQVICGDFAETIRSLNIRSADYVCCITRGHRWDGVCLRQILPGTMPAYLGMIGSSRRVTGLLSQLAEEGFDRDRLASIHAPIGLPIGAVTPAEIALSICAELVSVRRSRGENEPGLLRRTDADRAVLEALAHGSGPRAFLLVTETRGSTPVESGALMALDAEGRIWGSVGGGCGEAAALSRARRLLGTGKQALVDVDLSADAAESEGMVCGGHMRLLAEDVADDG